MTVQTLADMLIGLGLVGWIVYRQLTWRIVSISRMWRLPLVLAVVGFAMLARANGGHVISAVDVAVLVIELAISIGIGLMMGRIAVIRSRTVQPGDSGDRSAGHPRNLRGGSRIERGLNPDGTETVLESRTGWLGLVLWIVLILVRIGCDVVAGQLGSTLATSIGVILVMVAANRAARTFIFAARVQNRSAVTA
ncbi:MAG: hypothetical protein EPN48_09185 [Microbacteriaceae bacterium]|nr:MAG: hypothetical protein EPN48_09185 [Microbacteriaceae bacterium]